MERNSLQTDRACFIRRFAPALVNESLHETGALSGKSIAIKDNVDIEGTITGAGNPVWASTHREAAANAPVVDILLEAGGHLTGKTHMDELAFSLMGANHHYGTPENPAAPARVCGGSSSGSASAVAQGLADIGIGSDTGGSVRLPASFCGLYGLRPSHGIIPVTGMVPLAPTYDTVGFMTRSAQELRQVADLFIGRSNSNAPVHISFWAPCDLWEMADPETVAALRDRFDLSDMADAPLLAPLDDIDWTETFRVHQSYEVWQVFGDWISRNDPHFGPGLRERFAFAQSVTAQRFNSVKSARRRIDAYLKTVINPSTVLVVPTAPGPAPFRNASADAIENYRRRALSLLCVAGHAGLPQLTLPGAAVAGAPVGLSLIAAKGQDQALLSLIERFHD